MAFGKAQETKAISGDFKRYYGIGNFLVKGVNPTKKELSDFNGREVEEEPIYISTIEENGESVKSVRITFLVEHKDLKNIEDPIDFKTNITFFLRYRYKWNKDHTKVQVIDKYGYSGWATKEQCEKGEQLKSGRGDALRISDTYRPAFEGEVELTEFIKIYLGIAEARTWNKSIGGWVNNPRMLDLNECECRLDNIKEYFSGNFKELKEVAKIAPNNTIKVCMGIRTTDDGKKYSHAYTKMFLPSNTTDYTKIEKEVKSSQEAGAIKNVEFCFEDLKEYIVESTQFNEETAKTTQPEVSVPMNPDDTLPF